VPGPRPVGEAARARILLEVTSAVVSHLGLGDLLRAVSACLKQFFEHDFASLVIYEEEAGRLRVHALAAPPPGGVLGEGAFMPLEGTPPGLAILTRRTVRRDRIDLNEFPSPHMRLAYDAGLRSGCAVPLVSHGRVLGTINVASLREAAFTAADVELLEEIAGPVAIAVENALNFERARRERERSQLLLEVNNAVVSHLDLQQLVRIVSASLRDRLPHDAAGIALYEPEQDHLREYTNVNYGPLETFRVGDTIPIEGTPAGEVFTTGRPMLIRRPDPAAYPADRYSRNPVEGSPKSACLAPLAAHGRKLGIAGVSSTEEERFTEADLELFSQLTAQIAIAVENALNFERARTAEREVRRKLERERLMLEINNAVVSQLDLRELVRVVSASLREVLQPDVTGISLYDPATNQFRAYFFDLPANLPPIEEGTPMPLEGTFGGLAFMSGRPVFMGRPDPGVQAHEFDQRMIDAGIQSGGVVPLIAHDRKLGFLGVGSFQEDAFSVDDQELLCHIANQIALAVENALNFERATKERERAQTLLEVNNAITTTLDLGELLRATSACLRECFKHDVAGMALYDAESGQLRVHTLESPEPSSLYVEQGFLMPLEGSPAGLAFTSRRSVLIPRLADWQPRTPVLERALAAGVRSSCNAPLISNDRALGAVMVASRREAAFDESDAELLSHLARQLAIAVENALQYREIEALKNKLASEKLYLEEELRAEYNFAEIVGQSRALKNVLQQLKTVAPTDSVVLITGETGTGKELIARAVHDLSARRERTMVKVNCAAIPTGLLESEFFGHEKGAFTGAVTQRAGRFELAHRGTLFLDEVGEIPLELQPKLLRVLQEQEFERLGGSRTIKVDVRLIAATNCNLREMVAEKKFRGDLFYRLNVFPIFLPPLRERAEDIALLAGYFAQKHSRRMNKRIDAIPSETIAALRNYHWPGNVRELENFIERAVILTPGRELQAPLAELGAFDGDGHAATPAATPGLLSLADAERAHIEEVLRHTKGVVGGRGGAAEILGLPISTLRGRMKKLGLI
jgi:formate hydrogenlyase transcriptional activator